MSLSRMMTRSRSRKRSTKKQCTQKCLLGSELSFEKARVQEGRPLVPACTSTGPGLHCYKCKRWCCDFCLRRFIAAAGRLADNDRWCLEVREYLQTGEAPTEFLGCCCELRELKEAIYKARHDRYMADPVPTRYDGYLLYDEFGIVISPPLDGVVDIHGSNKYVGPDGTLPAAFHCVLGEKPTQRYHTNDIRLTGSSVRLEHLTPDGPEDVPDSSGHQQGSTTKT